MSLPRPGESTEAWNKRRLKELLDSKPTQVYVSRNGVWGADLADGGSLSSYEKLDYHTGCRAFLESVIKAGVRVVNYSDIKLDGSVKPPSTVTKDQLDQLFSTVHRIGSDLRIDWEARTVYVESFRFDDNNQRIREIEFKF